jgi:hypothetical protein
MAPASLIAYRDASVRRPVCLALTRTMELRVSVSVQRARHSTSTEFAPRCIGVDDEIYFRSLKVLAYNKEVNSFGEAFRLDSHLYI